MQAARGSKARGTYFLEKLCPDISHSKNWPDCAVFSDGSFVVVWDTVNSTGDTIDYWIGYYDESGTPFWEPTRINEHTSLTPLGSTGYGVPDIAVSEIQGIKAGFAVWERYFPPGDRDRSLVSGRKFILNDQSMTAQDEEFVHWRISTEFSQHRPMIDINGNGDILVSWIDGSDDTRRVAAKQGSLITSGWGDPGHRSPEYDSLQPVKACNGLHGDSGWKNKSDHHLGIQEG